MFPTTAGDRAPGTTATAEYCAQLRAWMWQCYCGHAWQSWAALSASQGPDRPAWSSHPPPFSLPAASHQTEPQDGSQSQAGQEYNIPSPLQRLLAEALDVCILFCVQVTAVLWFMRLTGIKDMATFIAQFIVVEINETTPADDLQMMMTVALVYRAYVCVYETVCLWGTGGVTPGKLLLGLQVVKCDSATPVRSNRVLVVPGSKISLSASAVRALNKNFSIAFFITVLFFQHNRPVHDIVAGTIVVQRRWTRYQFL